MRTLLIFATLIMVSLALGSTIMTLAVVNDLEHPVSSVTPSQAPTSVQGLVTITIEPAHGGGRIP